MDTPATSSRSARDPGLELLLVEDDPHTSQLLGELLRQEGHHVTLLDTGDAALETLATRRFDVVLADVRLPGADGHAILARVRERAPTTSVILMSAYASIGEAVRSMKERATHYLAKPFDLSELLHLLEALEEERHAHLELDELEPRLVGHTPAILRLKEGLPVIARCDSSVLLEGESGTGKELVARIIHERSGRKAAPFIAVSCAALSDESLERELFGGQPDGSREGRYRAASGGTLFLDEVDEMSLSAQARLLRALEDRGRTPSDAAREALDVRIVAATSADLGARVESGRFRADLFYKLKVFQLRLPPLRERIADLPLLVQSFYERASGQIGERFPASPRAWAALDRYDYPGNVRELLHAVEHAVVLARGGPIDLEHLPEELRGPGGERGEPSRPSLPSAVREFERECLVRTLAKAGGQRQRAADLLGISRKTLWVKLKQYGIGGDDEDDPR